MNEKLRDFLVKLRRFWSKARYAIVPLVTVLVLYQAGVALTLLPQFGSVQYALSKKLDREVPALSIYINDEYYGTMESETEIQKAWGQAIRRVITETGVNYKIDAFYKVKDAVSRSSKMTPDGEMTEQFYRYILSQLHHYSFVGYAVHIDESVFVLRSEEEVFRFFELLGQDAVDPAVYRVDCVSFSNGEPNFDIIPVSEEGGEVVSFAGSTIASTIEAGSKPTESQISNRFVGIYISGEKGYQTVYVRDTDVLSAEEAYGMCVSPTVYETDYVIKKGDKIANLLKTFNMTIDQFCALNPSYTAKSSLVSGRVLRVLSSEKKVSAYQVFRSVSKNAFSADTVYSYNPKKESTYSVVTNPGKDGLALMDEFVFYADGEKTFSSRIGEVVLEEAVAREITVGSKAAPTFIWPTEGRISLGFGVKGSQFLLKEGHSGIDIINKPGTYIYASASGEVVKAEYGISHGWSITISHGNGYFTEYSHCSSLLVSEGDYVEQGQIIALMGNTGTLSTGTHLHFAVVNNSSGEWDYFDPLRYLNQR